ncbi:MAG: DUF58 domain-containing protein [Myxococcota bacterium]
MLRPTRAGWCFFAVIFAVGFAALNTGNNLLYLVLSLMLAFLALSGVLSESALRGLEVRRRLPREIFAGRPNSVVLEIHNRQQRVPSFAIVVEDRLVACPADHDWEEDETVPGGRSFALRIDPEGRVQRRYQWSPARRGPVRFWGFQVSTRFPFGLFLKSMRVPAADDALVYPAMESVSHAPTRSGIEREGDLEHDDRGRGIVASGVREYTEGDSPRRIHWRSSLRRGALLVRELDDERDAEVEVLLRTAGARAGEDFEKRVSWAASEAAAHLAAGLRVALRTDRERIDPGSGLGQRARLLSFLARIQPGAGADASDEPASQGDPGAELATGAPAARRAR